MGRKFEILEGYAKPITILLNEQTLIKVIEYVLVIFIIGGSWQGPFHLTASSTFLYSYPMLLNASAVVAHSER